MSWVRGIKKLSLGIYGSNYESIERNVDDGKVEISHVFRPIYNACYFAKILGTDETKANILSQISCKVGRAPFNLVKSKNQWTAYWKSGSKKVPTSEIARSIGNTQIKQICAKGKLSKAARKVVKVMLASEPYFQNMGLCIRIKLLTIMHMT